MSERKVWETEPQAPDPIVLAELRDSPALRGLMQPVADAAAAMAAAIAGLKAANDAQAATLAERIEVRDTALIATLNEIVAAVAAVKLVANLEVPSVVVNVPEQAAPVVNVAPAQVTVSPTIEVTPVSWTFAHTYDRAGNLTTTKATPTIA